MAWLPLKLDRPACSFYLQQTPYISCSTSFFQRKNGICAVLLCWLALQEAVACSIMSFTNIKIIGTLSTLLPSPVCVMYQLDANYFPVESRNTDVFNRGREKIEIFWDVTLRCSARTVSSDTQSKFNAFNTPYYTVGWGTELQAGRSRVRFQMVSLKFFFDIILQAALRPWGWFSL